MGNVNSTILVSELAELQIHQSNILGE